MPAFLIDGRLMVGFDDAAHARRELVALIDRQNRPVGEVDNVWLGTLSASRLGLALLALGIGAFNVKDFVAFGRGPCLRSRA